MIRVIYGQKGMGKTKTLIDTANKLSQEARGTIVFVDYTSQLMYDLKREIRFVNTSDFPLTGCDSFMGFICGMLSQNYDIQGIFIDGLNFITKQKAVEHESFFESLKLISDKYKVDFYVTISGGNDEMPEYLSKFMS